MKNKRLLRSIIAIVLCAVMLSGIVAVGVEAFQKKTITPSIDKDNNLPVVRPKDPINSSASASVTTENGATTKDVTLESEDGAIWAVVPSGTLLNDGATKVTLTVEELDNSQANVELEANEQKSSIDVHVEGVSANNTTPIKVYIKELLPVGLNMGNYKFYHVENGTTVEMTLLGDSEPVHNNYTYDPATGDCVLYLASFSEVAVVNDTDNAWNGTVATAFADGAGTEADPYIIANADQLAYLSQIVSKDNEDEDETNDYGNKRYKLIADINLGGESQVFYPIGYWAKQNDKNSAGEEWYTYGGSFKGVFDGNGHTIKNIYQNTWAMDGDYDNGYWNDAMGLFGYVHGGTIQNLTVDNFSSDGEFTPTGVIAAYAANSTFKNIAITNCNPRVYNTGNGGIVGVGGNSSDTKDMALNFENITVDNTNKISALWGSWDVACGGLMGMYRGYSEVNLKNCHVAAQIDVYNDVCGNYQYYWYRYAGMMIGSIRGRNIQDKNGYTVPDTSSIHAEACTVHFGKWNDYYYCELVANSIASYTHDHQFSRLEVIDSLDDIKSGDTWSKAGNFLLIDGDTKTCYHIVSKDGVLTQHNHVDAGYEDEKQIDENGDGIIDLKEDKQIVYLPFNQLFQGDGWGVKHVPVYNGDSYAFDGITILDREIADSVVKFEKQFTGDFLYRIGNINAVSLSSLFKALDGANINSSGVWVTIEKVDKNSDVSGTFKADTTDWTKGTIKFSGTGVVKVTIQDYNYCKPTELYLEVVNATNVTLSSELGNRTSVLLDNITANSLYLSNATLYGNGFTLNVSNGPFNGTGAITNNYLVGIANANLDNIQITGAVYTEYGAQASNDYNRACVLTSGNCTISNSYISNCASAVRVKDGNLEIINSTLKGGNFANLDIRGGNVALENVTTINQSLGNDKATDGSTVVGLGIVIYYEQVSDTTTVTVKGALTQYNNISDNDEFSNAYAKQLVSEMLGSNHTDLQFEQGGVTWVNAGIVSMTPEMEDNIFVDESNGYTGKAVTFNSVTGYVCTTIPTSTSISQNAPSYESNCQGAIAPDFSFDYTSKNYVEKIDGSNDYCYYESGTVRISMDNGDSFNWATDILTLTKNGSTINYTVQMNGTDYTGKSITFSEAGNYTITYTYTDNNNYDIDENGNIVTYPKTYTKTVHIYVSVIKDTTKHAEFTFGSNNQTVEKINVNNQTYLSATNKTADGTSWGCMTVGTTKIYYPIVEAEIVKTADAVSILNKAAEVQAYFYVFDGIIAITDYENAGTGNKVIYNAETTTMPSGLAVDKGNFGAVSKNTTWYSSYNETSLTLSGASNVFKYAASGSASETPTTKSNKLCFTSPSGLAVTSRTEYYTLVQYSYTDFAGSTYYYFVGYHMQDANEVVNSGTESGGDSSCLAEGTMITLANGSKKAVEDLRKGDMVMAFDHITGEIVYKDVIIVVKTYSDVFYKNIFVFDDGTELTAINEHGIFDLDVNGYVNIDYNNYEKYIGHRFVSIDSNGNIGVKKLENVISTCESGYKYDIVTNSTLNYVAEDTLSVTHVLVNVINGFDFGSDLKYDAEKMQSDVETYGLYTYEEWEEYCDISVFDQYQIAVMKVGISKGLYTQEYIVGLINTYVLNDDVQIID